MGGADCDGQGVDAGAGHELLDLLGTGVGGILGRNIDLVLNAGQGAQLAFDHDAVVMGVLDDLLGQSDVVLEGLGGAVDHDGGEAAVDAALAQLEGVAVVQMHADGEIEASGLLSVLDGSLNQLHQVGMLGIGARALGDLKDQRSMLLNSSLGDALDDFHVVYVESADGVAAVVGLLEHLFGSYDCHKLTPLILV